jgi:hypothetical protein
MELDLGPETAGFRAELREWIAAGAPPGLAELTDWHAVLVAGGNRGERGERLARAWGHPLFAEWTAKLAERRLICPHWPREYGGQGMDAVHVAVLNEEFHRAGVPRVSRGMGEGLVGPSVIMHGTPEQQAYFLPRIISGEDVYCQGFSEPGHCSDLAAVDTRGVVDGDEVSSGTWRRTRASAARQPTRWSASSSPGPTPRRRSCGSAGCAPRPGGQGAAAGPGGVGRQAVLERVPGTTGHRTTGGGLRGRHRRCRLAAGGRPARPAGGCSGADDVEPAPVRDETRRIPNGRGAPPRHQVRREAR